MIYVKKDTIIKRKKDNARLYPLYKMLSFDLLCYYAISFLFLTITKGFSYAEVLLIESCLPLIKATLQMPTYLFINKIGKKNTLVIGNFLTIIYLLQVMMCNSLTSLIVAVVILAIGVTFKDMTASNILYESLNTKEGKGMYSLQEERGLYYYYFLDALLAVFTGFLFVINPYYPLTMSVIFAILAFLVSLLFRELNITEKVLKKQEKNNIKINEIKNDIKNKKNITKRKIKNIFSIVNMQDIIKSVEFILKSKRLRSLFLFGAVFSSFTYVFSVLRRAMLASINIEPEYFSIIFAILIFTGGISTLNINKTKKYLGRNILSILLVITIICGFLSGIVYITSINIITKTIILFILFLIQYICISPYSSLMEKYLKSFSKIKTRGKIKAIYNIIIYLFQAIVTFIASYILGYLNICSVVLIITVIYIILGIFISKYTEDKLGLNPEEYNTNDIEILNTKIKNKIN